MEHDLVAERVAFTQHVRDALHHLHERAALEAHPLASLLGDGPPLTGSALRRLLLKAIEQLRPEGRGDLPDPDHQLGSLTQAWRRYRFLVLRYVEGKGFDEISRELNVSSRQGYRDHAGALGALVTVLWDRQTASVAATPGPSADLWVRDRLEAEVARFGRAVDAAPSSLGGALQSALGTVQEMAQRQRVTFESRLPSDLPPVRVDRTVLRQILLRILVSILETSQNTHVAIAGTVASGRVSVQFATAAPPVGEMAPAFGSQARASLAVGAHLAAMHWGRLTSTARPWPLVELELSLSPATQPVVLVVDDNPDFSHLVSRYLVERGCRVAPATNAEAALAQARDLRPSAIVLDVLMPGCDGWELLRELRESVATRAIPVIVCSILPDLGLARSLGVAAFLAKPISRAKLVAALDPFLAPRSRETVDLARP
jgi:CheY-like chemotaxis protein